MSDSVDQPNWSALPHDPEAFFELAPGFDRRDLKRSYSKLIRVYKPERHPEEFQRIRAAFEQLDSQLRYGKSAQNSAANPPARDWNEAAEETAKTRDGQDKRSESATLPLPAQIIERVLAESPQAVYDEISERADKSPYEFYCLAVLSDLLAVSGKGPRKTLRFSRWLIKGVEAHPYDPSLLHLLREDLARAARVEDLPALLESSAQAVPRDDWYALTEPAWERLLRVVPFEEFVKLLERCEAHLRDISISYRITFTMRVLRYAVLSDQTIEANRLWVEAAFAFVEENFQEVPPQLEMEIELLAAVKQYASVRGEFLNGNALRTKLDAALKSYMTEEQALGDQAVLDVQLAILAEPQAVLEAFPEEQSDMVATFYDCWSWAAADVGDRYGTPQGEIDGALWQQRTAQMLQECEKLAGRDRLSSKASLRRAMHSIATWFGGFFLIVGLTLTSCLSILALELSNNVETITILCAMFASIGLGLWLVFVIARMTRTWFVAPSEIQASEKAFNLIYRRQTAHFMHRSRVPYSILRQMIGECWQIGKVDVFQAVHRLQNDYGLAFYSLALPFAT